MNENMRASVAKFSALGIYLLIAFEFFYMASPFAMYFYTVYKPGLGLINKLPLLAWSSGFFLPHLVADTKSALLNYISMVAVVIALGGFLLFIVCASQIYYSKLFKKKAVTAGIYRFIRHPQYAAFAVCSLGLLLLWPRYLTLFFFITLLFVYNWLAHKEEKECIQKFGKEYMLYKAKTAMFFPLPVWFRMPATLTRILNRISTFVLYILVVGIALAAANGLKKWSVRQLYSFSSAKIIWIAIQKTGNSDFEEYSRLIQGSATIDSLIKKKEKGTDELIFYTLPAEMYISEIPMIKPDNETCHVSPGNYNRSEIKIIITRGKHKNEQRILTGNKLLEKTLMLKPILEVWINTESDSILKIIDLPESDRYANIPEPIF